MHLGNWLLHLQINMHAPLYIYAFFIVALFPRRLTSDFTLSHSILNIGTFSKKRVDKFTMQPQFLRVNLLQKFDASHGILKGNSYSKRESEIYSKGNRQLANFLNRRTSKTVSLGSHHCIKLDVLVTTFLLCFVVESEAAQF